MTPSTAPPPTATANPNPWPRRRPYPGAVRSRTIRKALAATAADPNQRKREPIRLAKYDPVVKQRDFHAAGAHVRERLLKAGNQIGKTLAGAAEMAMHLTGRYPDWWTGKRFPHAIRAWAASDTFETTRDGIQRLLLGDPKDRESWGRAMIPKGDIVRMTRRSGVSDALDGLVVRHITGGKSTLTFKSFDQGRVKWQGETLDLVRFDEEPSLDVYMEGLTRTNATGGMVYITLTPLKGLTPLLQLFEKLPGFWE